MKFNFVPFLNSAFCRRFFPDLEELVDGNILICFEYRNGKLFEIRPAHIKYFDKSDFEYLENGEEIRIRRLKFEKCKINKTETERK